MHSALSRCRRCRHGHHHPRQKPTSLSLSSTDMPGPLRALATLAILPAALAWSSCSFPKVDWLLHDTGIDGNQSATSVVAGMGSFAYIGGYTAGARLCRLPHSISYTHSPCACRALAAGTQTLETTASDTVCQQPHVHVPVPSSVSHSCLYAASCTVDYARRR